MVFGKEILALFGAEFKNALPVLKVLSFAHFSEAFLGHKCHLINDKS